MRHMREVTVIISKDENHAYKHEEHKMLNAGYDEGGNYVVSFTDGDSIKRIRYALNNLVIIEKD